MQKKLGLVLEGGGVKGAYQAGALKAVYELGVSFDGVAGTSIGAINGALLLQGGFQLLSDTWNEVTTCTVFDIDDEMIAKFRKKDFDLDVLFYAGKKLTSLREVIRSSYEISSDFLKERAKEEMIRNSPMDYGFVTYDMTDMKAVEVMKQDVPEGLLIDYIIASATFPIFPAKIIEGKKYIDGGVYDNMPINLLARNGYDKMLVIRTNTMSKTPKRRLERNDLELFTIAPEKDLGRAMSFSEEKIINLRELGYNDCMAALENGLREFLLDLPMPVKKDAGDAENSDKAALKVAAKTAKAKQKAADKTARNSESASNTEPVSDKKTADKQKEYGIASKAIDLIAGKLAGKSAAKQDVKTASVSEAKNKQKTASDHENESEKTKPEKITKSDKASAKAVVKQSAKENKSTEKAEKTAEKAEKTAEKAFNKAKINEAVLNEAVTEKETDAVAAEIDSQDKSSEGLHIVEKIKSVSKKLKINKTTDKN